MKNQKPKTFELALQQNKSTILRLAKSFEYSSPYVDKDDLISCGMIGLFQCWKKFKSNETTKFSTFAYFRIKGSMLDEVRKNQIHKRHVFDKIKKNEQVGDSNLLYIATYKNISASKLELKDASVDRPIGELIQTEKKQNINCAINRLENFEQKVIRFRYHDELKLKEVGKILNLSEARIHQIQKTAISKLKDVIDEESVA